MGLFLMVRRFFLGLRFRCRPSTTDFPGVMSSPEMGIYRDGEPLPVDWATELGTLVASSVADDEELIPVDNDDLHDELLDGLVQRATSGTWRHPGILRRQIGRVFEFWHVVGEVCSVVIRGACVTAAICGAPPTTHQNSTQVAARTGASRNWATSSTRRNKCWTA